MIRLADPRAGAEARSWCSPRCSSWRPPGSSRSTATAGWSTRVYGAPGRAAGAARGRGRGRRRARARSAARRCPTTGPSAGSASTRRCWSAAGSGCARRGSSRPMRPGVIELVIDPGQAFGTGAHPTTRLCLELLLELEPRGSFADLGCGSGVLAIAAAKLGFGPVTALDSDRAAVDGDARQRARQRRRRSTASSASTCASEPPPRGRRGRGEPDAAAAAARGRADGGQAAGADPVRACSTTRPTRWRPRSRRCGARSGCRTRAGRALLTLGSHGRAPADRRAGARRRRSVHRALGEHAGDLLPPRDASPGPRRGGCARGSSGTAAADRRRRRGRRR